MRRFAEPSHPVWSLLRFAVAGIVLTVVLAFNATHFDETEAKAISAFLTLYGGMEGGIYLSQRKRD